MKTYKIDMISCLPDEVTLKLRYDETGIFYNEPFDKTSEDAQKLYNFLFDNISTSTLIQLAKIINKIPERLN